MLIYLGSRVNPVEHIYAAFPAFLYLNASLGGALLRPLLEYQANLAGQAFAAADIGTAYPAAPATEAVPQSGVEGECPFALANVIGCVMTDVAFF